METLATAVTLLFALYYALMFVDLIPWNTDPGPTVRLIVKLVLIGVWVFWWLKLAGRF